MPRLPRVYIKDSVYYVTCKGVPNMKIFKDREDFQMYFGLLKKYVEQHGVKLYAYSLMPRHLHLLMEVDEKTAISAVMHNLTSSYTKYYNSRYERKGHLFRERFKAALVEKDPRILVGLTAYIHLNAQKLNLAIAGETYPYSSYGLYLDYEQHNAEGLILKEQINEVLGVLAGQNYGEYVKKMDESEEFKKVYRKLQRKGMFGSEAFIKKVKKEIEKFKNNENMQEGAEDLPAEPGKNISRRIGTALLIFTLTAGGIYLYFDYARKPIEKNDVSNLSAQNTEILRDLNATEWQIQLIGKDGKVVSTDILTFKNGKIVSALLSQKNYPNSNYSMNIEDNKIIWETMQTSDSGTASWHGEVEAGKMRGILSLREEGKEAQDFSFKSIKFLKK